MKQPAFSSRFTVLVVVLNNVPQYLASPFLSRYSCYQICETSFVFHFARETVRLYCNMTPIRSNRCKNTRRVKLRKNSFLHFSRATKFTRQRLNFPTKFTRRLNLLGRLNVDLVGNCNVDIANCNVDVANCNVFITLSLVEYKLLGNMSSKFAS